jgi:hypothetical protein
MSSAVLDSLPRLHPVEQLRGRIASVEPYPPGMVPVPAPLSGAGFFPGFAGLWGAASGTPLPPMPIGGVMVLGCDFYSEESYRRIQEAGAAWDGSATWRELPVLFRRVGLDPARCFFTNAYMGLRAGTQNVGPFPGARDAGFVERCRAFLGEQIAVQRPRLILTLGSQVPAVLAPLSLQLARWIGVT